MASIEIKTISSVKSGNPDFEDLKIGDLFRYPGSVGSNYYMKIRQFSEKTAYALCLPEGIFYRVTASKEIVVLKTTQAIEMRNI